MGLVAVAKKNDIANGKMIGVVVDDKKILVANLGGSLYALDAVCSHMGGDLSKGRIESDIVICPRHGAQYDIRTGKVVKDVGFAAKALTLGRGASGQSTYKVVVEGDDIKVEL